jgi:hypothetical protein
MDTIATKVKKVIVFAIMCVICLGAFVPVAIVLNVFCVYFDIPAIVFLPIAALIAGGMGLWFKENLCSLYNDLFNGDY